MVVDVEGDIVKVDDELRSSREGVLKGLWVSRDPA